MLNRAAIRDRLQRRDRHSGLLLLLLAVGVVALLARIIWLDSSPPGFALEEARQARYARSIGNGDGAFPLLPATAEPGAREPLFAWWLKATGSLSGWSVAGARLASALAGAAMALACALWYRRALGTGWGLAGGLLAATSFWQLILSRQVTAGMLGAALLALGIWALWHGLEAEDATEPRRLPRWAWCALSGMTCGLAGYAYAPLLAFVPVVLLAGGALAWRTPQRDWRALALGAAVLLACVAPVAIDAAWHPGATGARLEASVSRDNDTTAQHSPSEIVRGVGTAVESLLWSGPREARVNLPGRALFDPLLALWTVLGSAWALRFAARPLHAFALVWLAGSLLVSAAMAPGQPELLLVASPVVFLLPVIALRVAHEYLQRLGSLARGMAHLLVAVTVLGSAGWSLYDYVEHWSPAPATWAAFDGDVREALAALANLPGGGEPAYVAGWDSQPLLDYLAPERTLLLVDGRSSLTIPDTASRLLVMPQSSAPDPALLAYVTGNGAEQPVASGLGPDGQPGWEIWRAGQSVRDRIPYTLPAIRFPNRIQLIGYAFAPDLGELATTGQLPDPPRLEIVLFWSVPSDMQPQQVEVRLVPADQPPLPETIESAFAWLAPPTPVTSQDMSGQRSIIMQRLSVPVPQTATMIVDIQATLRTADGTLRPAYGPRGLLYGDYAFLNRIQYQPDINDR